jgi:hypothetical protein
MSERISVLTLAWRVRQGESWPGGGGYTHREWLDFVIDGASLQGTLNETSNIGFIWWPGSDYQQQMIRQLLLEQPSELETGRRLLYVCPECGDVGCGAITVVVEEEDDCFVWSQFAVERDWEIEDLPMLDPTGYEHFGPYRFDKRQYREALLGWRNVKRP